MNARNTTWSTFLALAGAFGFISVQSGGVSYAVILYPVLAACLAQHAGHNESIIELLKGYLHDIDQQHHYRGYEHYVRSIPRRVQRGGHGKALLGALCTTELAATIIVLARLFSDHLPLAWTVLAGTGMLTIGLVTVDVSLVWLRGGNDHMSHPTLSCPNAQPTGTSRP